MKATKYRIKVYIFLTNKPYYKVQKRVFLWWWKDIRLDSPFVEYLTPAIECAERTLIKALKMDNL